jgi:hypothetical protein
MRAQRVVALTSAAPLRVCNLRSTKGVLDGGKKRRIRLPRCCVCAPIQRMITRP